MSSLEPATEIVIRATVDTMPGAMYSVAGLTAVDRAIKQQSRVPGAGVVVVTDGTVPLPAALPPNVRVQQVGPGAPDARSDAAVPANRVDPAGRPGTGGAPVLVVDEPTRVRAEDAIFAEMLRGDLGIVARWLNKPISFRITRRFLCHLPVTPNQVTLGAGLVGLIGCAFIATGSYAAVVFGFLLAHVQSVLDGCDGELARVRFQQSPIGEWLDTLTDDGLNLALCAALGFAFRNPARGLPTAGPWLAALAFAMLLFYNVVAYRELRRQGEGGEVLKVRWWFVRGDAIKAIAGHKKGGPVALIYNLGRRDVFVLAWFVFALLDWLPLTLVTALLIAGFSFVVALGQLLTRRAAVSPSGGPPPSPPAPAA
jgi:phosphatidylglycerophosphate synthase